VAASVSGSAIQTVAFSVNGRRVATDSRAPFRANLRFKRRALVRAHVATAFDQLVTLDRTVRGC
jgi:predicted nucleic acid-binding Zn ribbon protein